MTRSRIAPALMVALLAATGLSAQEVEMTTEEGVVSDSIAAESSAALEPEWHGCTHEQWGRPPGEGEGVENQHTMEYSHVLVPGPAISALGVETGAVCNYIAPSYIASRSLVCSGTVTLGSTRDDITWSVYVPESSRLIAMSCG